MDTFHHDFKELFYKNYEQLCSYAFKLIGDRNDCEDVVQEVMINFWKLKKDMISSPEARYYLYTAVRNRSISVLRKRIHMLSTEDTQLEIADEEYFEKPEQDIDQLVTRAFKGLSPKCAEIFKMSRMENLSYKQIAEKLNISIKTVENQMGKAIKHMRNFISQNPILSMPLIMILNHLAFS